LYKQKFGRNLTVEKMLEIQRQENIFMHQKKACSFYFSTMYFNFMEEKKQNQYELMFVANFLLFKQKNNS